MKWEEVPQDTKDFITGLSNWTPLASIVKEVMKRTGWEEHKVRVELIEKICSRYKSHSPRNPDILEHRKKDNCVELRCKL